MLRVEVYSGFNDKILKALELRIAAMTPNSVLCSVVVDEMTLKEQVTYNKERDQVEGVDDFEKGVRTHFFILWGLLDHWKQPAGYFLSSWPTDSERLHSLLLERIDKAEAAGLKVKVVVAAEKPSISFAG